MTKVIEAPAQAARAEGRGGPSASPPPRAAIAARLAVAGIYNPKIHCGSKTHQTTGPCRQRKGFRTDHPGSGRCYLHGGSSPSGRQAAERERVALTLESLAIPVEGDSLEVLQAAVNAAHGVMLAAQRLVAGEATEIKLKLYLEGIERAARVAKAAAEAINLDELVRIKEREADLLEAALIRTLERDGMPAKRRANFLAAFREELRGVLPAEAELN